MKKIVKSNLHSAIEYGKFNREELSNVCPNGYAIIYLEGEEDNDV